MKTPEYKEGPEAFKNFELCSQFLESEHRCSNHMAQSVEKQIGALSPIKAKCHFFQVGREMLRADSMPRSHDASLQKREGIFDGICMNVAHDVDFPAVVNGLMTSIHGQNYTGRQVAFVKYLIMPHFC